MKNTLLSICLFGLTVSLGRAQTIHSGSVSDQSTRQPIAFATVQNTTLHKATLSSEAGQFRITAAPNDTLLISCIGYKTARLVVQSDDQELSVQLIQEVKTLSEVVIHGWTESRFKQEFLKLNPPEKPQIDLRITKEAYIALGNVGRIGHDPTTLAPKVAVKGPISGLYDKFSRQAKLDRKLQEFQQADARRQQYQTRLDPVWMARITELQGDRLEAFMKYCKLPEPFVLSANDYDLIAAIRGCLKEFLVQEKEDKEQKG